MLDSIKYIMICKQLPEGEYFPDIEVRLDIGANFYWNTYLITRSFGNMLVEKNIKTSAREELINITPLVKNFLNGKGFRNGVCIVYVPHTTAGVTINENADPDVPDDIIMGLGRIVPRSLPFKHVEGNADAHLKAAMTGSSVLVPVQDGKPMLGTWQGIFFCEFDGPRTRRVLLQTISSQAE